MLDLKKVNYRTDDIWAQVEASRQISDRFSRFFATHFSNSNIDTLVFTKLLNNYFYCTLELNRMGIAPNRLMRDLALNEQYSCSLLESLRKSPGSPENLEHMRVFFQASMEFKKGGRPEILMEEINSEGPKIIKQLGELPSSSVISAYGKLGAKLKNFINAIARGPDLSSEENESIAILYSDFIGLLRASVLKN